MRTDGILLGEIEWISIKNETFAYNIKYFSLESFLSIFEPVEFF